MKDAVCIGILLISLALAVAVGVGIAIHDATAPCSSFRDVPIGHVPARCLPEILRAPDQGF